MRMFLITILVSFSWAVPCVRAQEDIPLGIRLPPSINFASPPTPVGSGARAEGMGGAFIAIADDATAASWNPAGLIQLERPELSCVGSVQVTRRAATSTGPTAALYPEDADEAALNYLSLAYPFNLFRRDFVASLNLQRLYSFENGGRIEAAFEEMVGGQLIDFFEEGTLYTITPAIAIQVVPSFSLGVAVNFWKDGAPGKGWSQAVSVAAEGIGIVNSQVVPFSYSGSIEESYGFFGINVTVGALWRLSRVFTVGCVVKTPFRASLDFSHRSSLQVRFKAPIEEEYSFANAFHEDISMDMPLIYGFGLAARVSDALSFDVDFHRTEWSGFQREIVEMPEFIEVDSDIATGKGRAVLEGKAGATNHVRLGGEYLFLFDPFVMPVRFGVFYDPEPNVNHPDDFWGVSCGIGFSWRRFSWDMAYRYRTGTVHNPTSTIDVDQHKFLFSLIYYI